MAVFRKVKKTDYTVIDNNIFKNQKLSLKGKGMVCTMLSLPDDWQFSEQGLTGLSNDGISSVRSTLKELMELGYLRRERDRDEKGVFRDYIYTIYEEPTLENLKQVEPILEKPKLENPILENQKTYKILKNKVSNNKKENVKRKSYFEDNELNDLFYEFLEMRKKLKAVNTDRAINLLLNKLNQYDDITKTKMIEQSITNSWKGVFEIKTKKESRYERERRLLQEMLKDE